MFFALYKEKLFPKLNFLILPCFSLICLTFKIQIFSDFIFPFCLCVVIMFLGLNLKIFSNIGRKTDYSYSIYLVHYPLIMIFISLGFFEINFYYGLFMVIFFSFLLSIFLDFIHKKIINKEEH